MGRRTVGRRGITLIFVVSIVQRILRPATVNQPEAIRNSVPKDCSIVERCVHVRVCRSKIIATVSMS